MRILLLSYYFPPEIGSGPHLPHELGESLVELGHEVTVVTSFPRYQVPVMPQQYRRRFFYKEEMGGMTVLRINAPNAYAKRTVVRGIVQQLAPWMLALRALPVKRPDVVCTMTPPLLMGLATRLVASRFRVPCVVNVQDLFPQAAVDLGLLRSRAVIRFFEALERRVYRAATALTVRSHGNRQYVVAKGGDRQRVFVVPDWADTDLIRPGERMNEFRAANGLENQFVVLFAGIMGWSQGLSTVVEAARILVDEPGLVFLLVGDGVERDGLERQAAGLANVRFLPMQSKDVYPQVLEACDVGLVTLRPEVATPVVPSKICTIMAAERPVIASLPLSGDAPRLIIDAQCGLVVPAGDAQALASAVLELKRNQPAAQEMGRHGRLYAEKHLSRSVCIQQMQEVLRFAVNAPPPAAGAQAVSSLNICRAEPADLDAIVAVHMAAFHSRFTMSALGLGFLRKYYHLILNYDRGILLVAEMQGRVVGFVAGFISPQRFYQTMNARKWRFALPIIKALVSRPWLVWRVLPLLDRVLHPVRRSPKPETIACELASIAVHPAASRQGTGRALVREFIRASRQNKATELYLTTDALDNARTNMFYRRLGFQFTRCYSAPGPRLMNEYLFAVDAESPPEAAAAAEFPHLAHRENPGGTSHHT